MTLEERAELERLRRDDPDFEDLVKLARLVARSRHVVVYTGAGISTGRGAELPTIRGKYGVSAQQLKEEDFDPASVQRLKPTLTHLALVALHRAGYVQFVCTQNIENLHRLSGLDDDECLWEAHGNVCLAACPSCDKRFRTDDIPDTKMCDECWDPKSINVRRSWRTGLLKRCVLSHYGAKVHVPEIARAHAKAADTALILGTSLSVHPFAKFATMPRRLAIVNLERTRSHDAEERAKVSYAFFLYFLPSSLRSSCVCTFIFSLALDFRARATRTYAFVLIV